MRSKLLHCAACCGLLCSVFVFFNVAGYVSSANAGQDLRELRQWIDKDPFVKIGGKMLFDKKTFQNAFKATVGPQIYKKFMEGYKGSKYFQSDSITEKNGIMAVSIQDLAYDFYLTIFIDDSNGWIDVCWNELNGIDAEHRPLDAMLFHDGQQVPVPYNKCQDITYDKVIAQYAPKAKKDISSEGMSTAALARQHTDDNADDLIGNWFGTFTMSNAHGKRYTATYEYAIYKDAANPDKLKFRQVDTLTFVNPGDVFECTMTNSYSNTFEGQIVSEADKLKFVQTKVGNPSCGSLGVDSYKRMGQRLEVIDINGGKATSGFLQRR